jgi:hypothetical protein
LGEFLSLFTVGDNGFSYASNAELILLVRGARGGGLLGSSGVLLLDPILSEWVKLELKIQT